MQHLEIDLENCYGIRAAKHTFDFRKGAHAIYAPNGSMKSSLYNTFRDISLGQDSSDRIFPDRLTKRRVVNEAGKDIDPGAIVVVAPYDAEFSHTEKTSTLLVDSRRRKEYEELHARLDQETGQFLATLKKQVKTKKDLAGEIASTFTKGTDLHQALARVPAEVAADGGLQFTDIPYDLVFDERVVDFLATKDFAVAVADYITKQNELLAKSPYFRKGTFNYYHATTVAKSLADNGFFDAKHFMTLNSEAPMEITAADQLEKVIAQEKARISNDADLRKKFTEIEKLLNKNAGLRSFQGFIEGRMDLLPELANLALFKEKVWKSYFKANLAAYEGLVTLYKGVETRKREIEAEAAKQRTQWERVIEIFNGRFSVPFKVEARNKASVVLGAASMLEVGFTFHEGKESATVEQAELMQVLSTGERKALYILNVIFEVEARKMEQATTLFLFDDIADSFDYKNKYAIIQYLKDIADEDRFRLLILTHNFDFFRTIESRKLVGYSQCLIAVRSPTGIMFQNATGIRNVFLKDWKPGFHQAARKRIACIAFMRNILEYIRGDADPDFLRLTALLHWRPETTAITHSDLDAIYTGLFQAPAAPWLAPTDAVHHTIHQEGAACLQAQDYANLENKIVLSVAIRLAAEKFMAMKIGDETFWKGISQNQTYALFRRYCRDFPNDESTIEVLDRVVLMTPENIHLNSFMYEPIMDMGDEHLRRLYQDVRALS